MSLISHGYRYGIPMPSARLEPYGPPNEDAVSKQKQIRFVCHELDLIRDLARLLDAAPVDVQERVAAWVMAKYGKPFVVAPSRPPVERNPLDMVPTTQPDPARWPTITTFPVYACPMPHGDDHWEHGLVGGANGVTIVRSVSDGFPVTVVDDSASVK